MSLKREKVMLPATYDSQRAMSEMGRTSVLPSNQAHSLLQRQGDVNTSMKWLCSLQALFLCTLPKLLLGF